jgi:adenylate cyclase
VAILDLGPLAFLALFAGSLVSLGYSAILHYFGLEAGMRPVLVDISRDLPPRLRIGVASLPLRYKLLAALPMINIITGLTAAVLSSNGEGGTGPSASRC